MPIDELLTTADVAKLLGRSTQVITMHARNYELGRHVGRAYLFTPDEVNRLREIIAAGPGRPRKEKGSNPGQNES